MVEGAPILPVPETPTDTPEKTDDKKDKKDKKKSRLGLFAIEKEPPKAEKDPNAKGVKKESRLEKAEPVSEEQAPAEELSAEESKVIVQESAEQRLASLPEAGKDADPAEDAAELAAHEFLAEAAESGDIDEALEKTAAKMEVTPEQMAELTAEPEKLEVVAEGEPESEDKPADEEIVFDRRAATEPEDGREETSLPPPPPGGRPPFGPLGGFGHPPGGGPAGPGFNPNAAPTPAAANTANQAPQYHETSPAAMALFGGIIGYLIGRRSGRIKTEKRLIPVQKKLEEQVTNLQFELQEKEKKIRRIAAAKVRQQGPQIVEVFKKEQSEKIIDKRQKAPEANLLHLPEAPEHIGQVLVTAGAVPIVSAEKAPQREVSKAEKTPERRSDPPSERRIETLNRVELLELSEKIVVEGSTLRQVYETHLISEKGLRRLVKEHLRGGNLVKALRREIVEREIDFERDPAMRDMAPDGEGAAGGGKAGGKMTLDQMLAKAGASVEGGNEEAAYYRARTDYEARRHAKQAQSRAVDVSLGIAIVVLLAAVIYLAFLRG